MRHFAIICCVIGVAMFASPAISQPQIAQTSGAFTQGEAISVSGSNFGQGPTIMRFDDFDNGSDESPITSWESNGTTPTYETSDQRTSRGNSHAQCNVSSGFNDQLRYDWETEKFYISFWQKNDFDDLNCYQGASPSRNIKMVKVIGTIYGGDPVHAEPSIRISGDYSDDLDVHMIRYYPYNESTYYRQYQYPDYTFTEQDEWHRVELYVEMGSFPDGVSAPYPSDDLIHIWDTNWYDDDTRNGIVNDQESFDEVFNSTVKMWVDSDMRVNRDNMLLRQDPDSRYSAIIFNHYFSNTDGCGAMLNTDDIYISDSQARIELGNASTWNSCTVREIQIPTDWESDTVTFNTSLGSFNNGDDVWIYIVDDLGQVNSEGFHGSWIAPGLPGQPIQN